MKTKIKNILKKVRKKIIAYTKKLKDQFSKINYIYIIFQKKTKNKIKMNKTQATDKKITKIRHKMRMINIESTLIQNCEGIIILQVLSNFPPLTFTIILYI